MPSALCQPVRDGYFDIIACLSCHDGNLAKVAMMKGTTVETVTIAGASFNPPTLLGNDGSTPGNYMNDHPVGPSANPGCGGPYNWDCTVGSDGSISFSGPNSKQFIADYYDVTKGSGPLAKHRESARNNLWIRRFDDQQLMGQLHHLPRPTRHALFQRRRFGARGD